MRPLQKFISLAAILALLTLSACAGTASSRSTGTYIDDKTISTKVEAQLAADSITKAIQVEVETYDGVVQLSGFVDSPAARQRAEEIARGVGGVKAVENDLQIR